MADTEYQETLDVLDKVSVCFYRSGITLFALCCLLLAAIEGLKMTDFALMSMLKTSSVWLFAVSAALTGGNIHVYSKSVRAVIKASAWCGIVLLLIVTQPTWQWLALGTLFVGFSAIALKESFCFQVPGLKLVPLLLIAAVVLMFVQIHWAVALVMALTGIIMGYLALAKWKMPLHFDIGIKANYQY